MITFGIIAPLTFLANKNRLFSLTLSNTPVMFSLKEILSFSAVISASDTVAALTFIKEKNEPKLFAILFGEGVINDAVCIVLYKIINNMNFNSDGGME